MRNVIDYLIASAEVYPNKIAFEDEEKSITYSELLLIAKKIGTCILKVNGAIKNKPIAVYMEKSIDVLCTYMGILYSGNFYSPIDIKTPKHRALNIINTLKPVSIIAKENFLLSFESDIAIIEYEKCLECEYSNDVEENRNKVLDIDPIYVLFTSGSTGVPKGVTISHRAVIDYTEWLKNIFKFDSDTVFGNQAPFYFDNSVLDIYSTLKNGSKLVIIPEKAFIFQKKLMDYLNKKKINTIFWVPSALIGVANSGILGKCVLPRLDKIIFCGEVMPNKQLNLWRKFFPDALYANLYGPTEITDVCTYYIVDREFRDDEPLPIGMACENTEILILNEDNLPVEIDEPGELCVRGCGVSLGYYANDEKTKDAFIQNPLNKNYRDIIYKTGDIVKYNEYGEIIYLSRKDFQIKHQGHRIELGEIEVATTSINGVQSSCALYDSKNNQIVLFYTAELINEKELFRHLKSLIPGYMLPSKIVLLKEFPLNANGKIDRVELNREYVNK